MCDAKTEAATENVQGREDEQRLYTAGAQAGEAVVETPCDPNPCDGVEERLRDRSGARLLGGLGLLHHGAAGGDPQESGPVDCQPVVNRPFRDALLRREGQWHALIC